MECDGESVGEVSGASWANAEAIGEQVIINAT